MPIYEFECEECGARFEQLLEADAAPPACSACGSDRTRRRYSPQAAGFRLVKSRGEARRQEGRNADLTRRTKARFKEKRRAQREARTKARGSDE